MALIGVSVPSSLDSGARRGIQASPSRYFSLSLSLSPSLPRSRYLPLSPSPSILLSLSLALSLSHTHLPKKLEALLMREVLALPQVVQRYRGKQPPLGPYCRTKPRALWRSQGGGAVSYEGGRQGALPQVDSIRCQTRHPKPEAQRIERRELLE